MCSAFLLGNLALKSSTMQQHRITLFSLFLLFCAVSSRGQTYQLIVQNGYGSGQYAAGDTVHIWAGEFPNSEVFRGWTGQFQYLIDRGEWHTQVVMPAQNVTVQANTKVMPPNSDLFLEEIMGRDTLKRVFSYFPVQPKGVVWFFHGTGGGAYAWVNSYDNRQLVNQCIADTFAVVITECEETTKNQDINNDGNFKRWHYDPDSVANVDFANLRAIRDTFINRGLLSAVTPQIGVGFSAGGAMAQIMGWYANWKVGINYGTGGVEGAAQVSTSPSMICPNRRDDHPDVGPISVQEAFVHQQMFLDRGVCSEVYVNEPGPLHPQRFSRRPGIALAQSQALFNDLKNNNCLGANNYLIKSNKQIEDLVVAQPQNWLSLAALGVQERLFVQDELAVLWSAHHFTADFNAKAMRFIRNACGGGVSAVPEPSMPVRALRLVPNPATDRVTIEGGIFGGLVRIFNITGQLVLEGSGPTVDVSRLAPGIYQVLTEQGVGRLAR